MLTKDGLVRIKWAGPNTPVVELTGLDRCVYPSKRELLSMRDAIDMFIDAYPGDFSEDKVGMQDDIDMALNIKQLQEEQEFNKKRWEALDKIAKEAGFDDDGFAYTEFSLMPFFEAIVEECAKQAELQARVYSDGNQGAGCYAAAHAVRVFGKTIGVEGKYGQLR